MLRVMFRTAINMLPILLLLLSIPGTGHAAGGTGTRPMTLDRIAHIYGLSRLRTGDTVELVSRENALTFNLNSRRCFYNGVLVWLNTAPTVRGKRWELSSADAKTMILPLLNPRQTLRNTATGSVTLDPGHGGSDSGATANGITEKHVNLTLALKVHDLLKEAGVPVVHLTRQTDETLTLAQRVERTRTSQADLFVSIHLNTSPHNPDAHGIETYMLSHPGYPSTAGGTPSDTIHPGNAFDAASTVLATKLHASVLKQVPITADRGIRHARFEVLRNASCPAVLIECGFMTNTAEAARLRDEAHLAQLAQAIAEGILAYRQAAHP